MARSTARPPARQVPVVITDTSSRAEDQEALHAACRQASVIVLCFRLDDESVSTSTSSSPSLSPSERPSSGLSNQRNASLRRISSYWMPELKRLNVKAPVRASRDHDDGRDASQLADSPTHPQTAN